MEIAAKFDQLFAKMDQAKLEYADVPKAHLDANGAKGEHFNAMSKFDDMKGPRLIAPEGCSPNDREYIERLPQRLKKTDKTAGILVADGHDIEVISGKAGAAQSMPAKSRGFDLVTKTHAEGHAIAFMIQNGIKEARIYINNPTICDSCERLIPRMLQPGSKLEVVLPDGKSRVFIGEQK